MSLGIIEKNGQHAPGTVMLLRQLEEDGFAQGRHDSDRVVPPVV